MNMKYTPNLVVSFFILSILFGCIFNIAILVELHFENMDPEHLLFTLLYFLHLHFTITFEYIYFKLLNINLDVSSNIKISSL